MASLLNQWGPAGPCLISAHCRAAKILWTLPYRIADRRAHCICSWTAPVSRSRAKASSTGASMAAPNGASGARFTLGSTRRCAARLLKQPSKFHLEKNNIVVVKYLKTTFKTLTRREVFDFKGGIGPEVAVYGMKGGRLWDGSAPEVAVYGIKGGRLWDRWPFMGSNTPAAAFSLIYPEYTRRAVTVGRQRWPFMGSLKTV